MNSSSLQEQARALGDPTRHAIFRHIAQAGHAVGIAELNDEFPFNHNTIRQHLAKLVAAGLVVETKAPAAAPMSTAQSSGRARRTESPPKGAMQTTNEATSAGRTSTKADTM